MTAMTTMTDRSIRTSDDLDRLDFSKGEGTLPVVAQHMRTGEVLMVAWATREALTASLESGDLHFWSRSRSELWRKGETSGNTLRVVSLNMDCDQDTVLAQVEPAGPACHTGERTCFGSGVEPGPLNRLARTIASRSRAAPDGSYTRRLLDDRNLRFKKLGEEVVELVTALADRDRDRATEEAADVIYHTLVALQAEGVTLLDVEAELARRSG